jgi:hypothetical protein
LRTLRRFFFSSPSEDFAGALLFLAVFALDSVVVLAGALEAVVEAGALEAVEAGCLYSSKHPQTNYFTNWVQVPWVPWLERVIKGDMRGNGDCKAKGVAVE